MTVYERVRRLCNNQGINISNLGDHLPNASVSKSTISGWKNGSTPRPAIIKAIADYFDVSPEYIANGNGTSVKPTDTSYRPGHHPVVIIDGNEEKLSEQEVALLEIYKDLDVIAKARLLAYASELQ